VKLAANSSGKTVSQFTEANPQNNDTDNGQRAAAFTEDRAQVFLLRWHPMSPTDLVPSDSTWSACPSGELRMLSQRLKRERRARAVLRATGASATAVLTVSLGAWLFVTAAPRAQAARITCPDVHGCAEQYLAGTLDDNLKARVELHLARCRKCRDWLEAQRHSGHESPATQSRRAAPFNARPTATLVSMERPQSRELASVGPATW
jgi:hypothetical protein